MSRSGYIDDYDDPRDLAMWRGRVASAIRGKRGQAFLRSLIEALDAMPERRLIAHDLQDADGAVCAIGSVGAQRGVEMSKLDPEDHETLAGMFDIAAPMVREIEWLNDEAGEWKETPEERWTRMRTWAEKMLKRPTSAA